MPSRIKHPANLSLILPNWDAPAMVRGFCTTRTGGVSVAPYASLNVGEHVADDPVAVAMNRARVRAYCPTEPVWLQQVHGTAVHVATDALYSAPPIADASVTRVPQVVCAIMTADCLPVLFCNRAGTVVAAAHAGWRGLLNGVLAQTVAVLGVPAQEVMAWLGPAIGIHAFEVGAEVRTAFVQKNPQCVLAFTENPARAGHYFADLYLLARQFLADIGVQSVSGGEYCTYTDAKQFFSYRREGITGRMVSTVWIDA